MTSVLFMCCSYIQGQALSLRYSKYMWAETNMVVIILYRKGIIACKNVRLISIFLSQYKSMDDGLLNSDLKGRGQIYNPSWSRCMVPREFRGDKYLYGEANAS